MITISTLILYFLFVLYAAFYLAISIILIVIIFLPPSKEIYAKRLIRQLEAKAEVKHNPHSSC